MPVFRLNDDPTLFPPPRLAEPEGLLALGGDLSPERLLAAYRLGVFPWYGPDDPILWWTPDPRLVLFPGRMHVSRRLARELRSGRFATRTDTSFREVIAACAAPRRDGDGTWLTPEMRAAYIRLHELGHAHSVECFRDGALVGGFYGVFLGRVFFGESMFFRERDASKIALAALAERAPALGVELIDCQVASEHLKSLGAEEIPRERFLALLEELGVQEEAGDNRALSWRTDWDSPGRLASA